MLSRIWKNWNTCTLSVGIEKHTATLKYSTAVTQKIKHTITI